MWFLVKKKMLFRAHEEPERGKVKEVKTFFCRDLLLRQLKWGSVSDLRQLIRKVQKLGLYTRSFLLITAVFIIIAVYYHYTAMYTQSKDIS